MEKLDYTKLANKRRENKEEVETTHAKTVHRQAKIKARWLLNDKNWDTYLSWVQADIEDITKVMESAREKLEDPSIVNHDEMVKAKILFLESKSMINALEIVISYPKKLLEGDVHKEDRSKDLKP